MARQLGGETVVAVFNTSRETRRLDLPLANLLADHTLLTECWGHEDARVETRDAPPLGARAAFRRGSYATPF